jgi:hypothetical protein
MPLSVLAQRIKQSAPDADPLDVVRTELEGLHAEGIIKVPSTVWRQWGDLSTSITAWATIVRAVHDGLLRYGDLIYGAGATVMGSVSHCRRARSWRSATLIPLAWPLRCGCTKRRAICPT